jgi:hypothetical protein
MEKPKVVPHKPELPLEEHGWVLETSSVCVCMSLPSIHILFLELNVLLEFMTRLDVYCPLYTTSFTYFYTRFISN